MINIIVAMSDNCAIGFDNQLIHMDKQDMNRFISLTKNSVVIMGRKTWQSLPTHKLPNRINYVISSQLHLHNDSELVSLPSLEEAIRWAKHDHPDKEIFIIGGESIYKQALKLGVVDSVYLTVYSFTATNADTYFPFELIAHWDGHTELETTTPIVPGIEVPMEFSIWTKPPEHYEFED